MKNKIVIIDGFNYLFRAYYGLPSAIKLPDGRQGNAVYGFFAFLRRVVKYLKPEDIIVVFDSETGTIKKKVDMPEYKSNRSDYDREMFQQLSIIKQLLMVAEVPIIEDPNCEADDIIGTLTSDMYFPQSTKYISSADNDFIQLVNDNIFIIREVQGQAKVFNKDDILNKYNITPFQYIDYISLKGDSSDNIKGVPGIGVVTAQKLLNKYKDIWGVMENSHKLKPKLSENIKEYQERIIKNKEFLQININLDLNSYSEILQKKYNSNILLSKTNEIIEKACSILSHF